MNDDQRYHNFLQESDLIRYLACTCCGARWWENESDSANSGCVWCGSSVIALERNLKAEAAQIIRDYGNRPGIPDA